MAKEVNIKKKNDYEYLVVEVALAFRNLKRFYHFKKKKT